MPLSSKIEKDLIRNTIKKYVLLFLGLVLIGSVFYFSTQQSTKGMKHRYDQYDYPESYFVEVEGNYMDYQEYFECGAYSSAYILGNFKEEVDGLSLFQDYPGKVSDGISPYGIQTFFKNRGYQIDYVEEGTIEDLKQDFYNTNGNVITFIRVEVNEPYTHYVALVGYDEDYFYFAESLPYKANIKDEGNFYNRKTTIEEFEKLWEDIDGMWKRPYFTIRK